MSDISEIKHELDKFIQTFYLRQALRGLFLGLIEIIAVAYTFNYVEYYGWLSAFWRGIVFFTWLFISLAILVRQFLVPLLKSYKIIARMTYFEASKIIGNHYSEISDKLQNLLELEYKLSSSDNALILNSIKQKTKSLRKFQFLGALNKRAFKNQLIRFSLFLGLLCIWGVFDAQKLVSASGRLINYSKIFPKTAPFSFIVEQDKLVVVEGETFELKVEIQGNVIPKSVNVLIDGREIPLQETAVGAYYAELQNIKKSTQIQFQSGEFFSDNYYLTVLNKPSWNNLQLQAIYPNYTNKKRELLNPFQTISVPAGTMLTWTFSAQNAITGSWKSNHSSGNINNDNDAWKWSLNIKTDDTVSAILIGDRGLETRYNAILNSIEDASPKIDAELELDSFNELMLHVVGFASDDYGLTKATIEWTTVGSASFTNSFDFKKFSGNESEIFNSLNLQKIGLKIGEDYRLRIGVWDNDAIAGSKVTYSNELNIRIKTESEKAIEKQNQLSQMQKQFSQFQSQSEKLRKQSEEIDRKLAQSKQMSFESKSKINEWMKQQKQQIEQLEKSIKKQQELNDKKRDSRDPELVKRKENLNKRMERLKDPELEKLMKELNELLKKNAPKEDVQRKMNQMNRAFKSQEEEIDALKEQLKELQLEEGIKEQSERMNDWIEKEKELSEKTKEASNEESEKINEELKSQNKELENIKYQAEKLKELNNDLKDPMDLKMGESEIKEAQKESEEAENNLQKKKNKQSSENQKNAASEMEKAKEQMEESLSKAKEQRNSEDMESLRSLLENLIEVSHRQEKVFTELKTLKADNPKVLELNKQQINLRDLSLGIEDSLRALARRQPMVSDLVTREMDEINNRMEDAISSLKIRDVRRSAMEEQYVMTGFNNLAVMLMESLKNVQQKMSQQSKQQSQSSKSCSNPNSQGKKGKGKKGQGSKLSESQKSLGERLQQLQEQQKGQQGKKKAEGKQQGKGKTGESTKDGITGNQGSQQSQEKDGKGGRELSKEYVEIALMQEQLRRQIAELKKEALKNGNSGASKKLSEMEELMEQQERDIVNQELNSKTVERQQEILTRLLEHEKAQRKQEEEEKRESSEGGESQVAIPKSMIQEMKKKKKELERLRKPVPEFNSYYKEKIQEFIID